MEEDNRKFLDAEQTAEKLVETLRGLQDEALSYQTASKELDDVKRSLMILIETTQQVVVDSHECVKVLRDIGGPEILNQLGEIDNRLEGLESQAKMLQWLIIGGFVVSVVILAAVY